MSRKLRIIVGLAVMLSVTAIAGPLLFAAYHFRSSVQAIAVEIDGESVQAYLVREYKGLQFEAFQDSLYIERGGHTYWHYVDHEALLARYRLSFDAERGQFVVWSGLREVDAYDGMGSDGDPRELPDVAEQHRDTDMP